MQYLVPLEENEVDGEVFVHMDVLTINGKPKQRAKRFRRYLTMRWNIWQYEAQTQVLRSMGFNDLL